MTVEIINMISSFMEQGVYNTKISRELKILAALRVFATGSTQTNLGDNFVLRLNQAMISRSIKEETDIMTKHLAPRHIRFSNTANEINRIKEGFFLKHRSIHDSAIWAASIIRTNIERKFREGNNIWLMGT
ncbi:hypothetical protein ILUMI_16732 [Ignelater luminosus]|uniref:Uncharacterized protein n=1 Tax=Ignelater luminosus TaxID=2038154 RepID=A0A8K0G889_IGNLU|nr:hypothetical protein ILUMI_16732 [Ignelater luminosus]